MYAIRSYYAFDCNQCHLDNGAIHDSSNESLTIHTRHANSPLGLTCANCHTNPGASGHNTGTVELGGTSITPESYTQGNFDGTCVNSCHLASAVDWATGSLVCGDCHGATYVGGELLGGHGDHGISVRNNFV